MGLGVLSITLIHGERVRAMAVSHDIHTFTMLGVLAGIPGMAYGVISPTG